MTKAIKELNPSSSFAYHNGTAYKYAEYEVGIIDMDDGASEYIVHVPQNHKDSAKKNELFSRSKKLKASVVYDPRKASDYINSVMSMVNDVELKLENTKHDDPAMTYTKLPSFVRRFLDYEVDENGMMHMIRKQNAFTFADNRAGMFVMLSSTNTTWEQMMTSYDVRDWVEKAFDVYKNDLDGKRNRTGNVERARGRFFIKFIALMMRIHIQNVLREHDHNTLSTRAKKDSVNGMTVDELLLSLNTVFAIGNTGNWRLTAISKNVREIFSTFGLEPPQSGQIILG